MLLSGLELVAYIKERQSRTVRSLRAQKIFPKLAVIYVNSNPIIETFIKVKQRYGMDIKVDVGVYRVSASDLTAMVKTLNQDKKVHGIIVQLPLPDEVDTDRILTQIDPKKDVDALGKKTLFEPPTPVAILWLLAGFNIDLNNKRVALIGQGRLVGKPLLKILRNSRINVSSYDERTKDLAKKLKTADIIISATGKAGLITNAMVKPHTVVVDAGTSSEAGKTVGDAEPSLYLRDDIKITPTPGGIGPLTVAALFENVIQAAS